MIRRLLTRLRERARSLLEPAVDALMTPPPPSRWHSPAYHVEILGSGVCPDCEGQKPVGDYRCQPCAKWVR